MSERVSPLTATDINILRKQAHALKGSDPIMQRVMAYAIQQSQEPSEAEIETVAREIASADDCGSDQYWRGYTRMACAAIRAIRGLDAEPTS